MFASVIVAWRIRDQRKDTEETGSPTVSLVRHGFTHKSVIVVKLEVVLEACKNTRLDNKCLRGLTL